MWWKKMPRYRNFFAFGLGNRDFFDELFGSTLLILIILALTDKKNSEHSSGKTLKHNTNTHINSHLNKLYKNANLS